MKNKPNFAGLIDMRKSRQDGVYVGLYNAYEAGLDPDGGPYVTVCEEHHNLVNHDTLVIAKSHMPYPSGWCDECRKAHYQKETIDDKIAKARKEIERLSKLDQSKYKRRLGSGNHSIATYIARQERTIELLEQQKKEQN